MLVLIAEPAVTVLARSARVVSVLSGDERQRAARFRRRSDREEFIGAHVAVRMCVAALTGGVASEIVVEQRCAQCGGPHGRPYVSGTPAVHVSWSHSGGWVSAAATDRGPLGIDIQAVCPPRADSVVWSTLSAAEALVVRSTADPYREFLRHWVVKEALVKAGVVGIDCLARAEALRPDFLLPNEFLDEVDLVGACVAPAQVARRLSAGAPDDPAWVSQPFAHPRGPLVAPERAPDWAPAPARRFPWPGPG